MKKLLSILLALTLVFAFFAGCQNTDENSDPSDSVQPSDSVEPSESADPGDADGETYSFGFVMMGTGEFFQAISEALVAGFEEIGWEASYANGEFDPATQIELIENYTAMGTDVIMVHPVSGAAISAAVDSAREAGSKVIVMVDPSENWDGLMSSDNVATGKANAWMLAQFVEEHWSDAEPGSIPVALLTNNSSFDSTQQSEGVRAITDYTDKVYVALEYEQDEQTMEAGMEAAENIYATNPEVTLFVTTSNAVACGINNYFTGMNSPVDDLSDYGVWGTNSAEEALNAIKATAEGNGMLRGINIQSGIPETVEIAVDIATGLMDGRYDKIEVPANVYLVNTENVDDWMANEYVNLRWDFENSVGIEE